MEFVNRKGATMTMEGTAIGNKNWHWTNHPCETVTVTPEKTTTSYFVSVIRDYQKTFHFEIGYSLDKKTLI